jgi:radical SAM superfamily enzyme YgiQ (UPF0313 family)
MASIIFWSAQPTKVSGLPIRYIGPYQLGHWLEKHGYEYQVIDFIINGRKEYYSVDELVEYTEKFIDEKTQVIGISSTFLFNYVANTNGYPYGSLPPLLYHAMMIIKSKYPNVKFVLGGNTAETFNANTTALFDAIVVGLAEDVMLNLIKYYDGVESEPKFRKILPHKTKFYYADDMPLKVFDIQKGDHSWQFKDCIVPGESLPLEISRGCIFKCRFCHYPLLGRSKYDYTRSMECIKEEIMDNYNKWGTTCYYLLDDTFNDSVQKVKDFRDMVLSLPFKIYFVCYLRADLLARFPETIPWLKESGLIGAQFGIESMHPEASKHIGKGWNGTEKAKEFLLNLIYKHWNNEVLILMSMIAGVPEETEESLLQSVNWLIDNNISHWRYEPLRISKYQDSKVFVSEWAKNAEKWGFTWPDNSFEWENTKYNWTYKQADEWATKLNGMKDVSKFRTHIWLAPMLITVGNDIESVINKTVKELRMPIQRQAGDLWIYTYKKILKGLPQKEDISNNLIEIKNKIKNI